jgi:hypothetical protein
VRTNLLIIVTSTAVTTTMSATQMDKAMYPREIMAQLKNQPHIIDAKTIKALFRACYGRGYNKHHKAFTQSLKSNDIITVSKVVRTGITIHGYQRSDSTSSVWVFDEDHLTPEEQVQCAQAIKEVVANSAFPMWYVREHVVKRVLGELIDPFALMVTNGYGLPGDCFSYVRNIANFSPNTRAGGAYLVCPPLAELLSREQAISCVRLMGVTLFSATPPAILTRFEAKGVLGDLERGFYKMVCSSLGIAGMAYTYVEDASTVSPNERECAAYVQTDCLWNDYLNNIDVSIGPLSSS